MEKNRLTSRFLVRSWHPIAYNLLNFVNVANTNQLSAYDDDWDDLSAFRGELNEMGVTTRSLVSSPLLLADIEDPRIQHSSLTGWKETHYPCHNLIPMD